MKTSNLDKNMFTAMFLKSGRHGKGCRNCRWWTRLETARRLDYTCKCRKHRGTQLGVFHLECQWMCRSGSSLHTHPTHECLRFSWSSILGQIQSSNPLEKISVNCCSKFFGDQMSFRFPINSITARKLFFAHVFWKVKTVRSIKYCFHEWNTLKINSDVFHN